MELIATGKWSKADKRWNMVVALRRAVRGLAHPPAKPSERPASSRVRPRQSPDK